MVTLILLFFLCYGFLIGLRRGFVMQVFRLLNFIVSFVVATLFFRKISHELSFWLPYPDLAEGSEWAVFLSSDPLENAFYNAISFALIFFSVKFLIQIIASMINLVARLPMIRFVNKWSGGVLGFIETYFILFIILYLLALTPLAFVQDHLDRSFLATFMIEYTPLVSNAVKSLWFTDLLSLIK